MLSDMLLNYIVRRFIKSIFRLNQSAEIHIIFHLCEVHNNENRCSESYLRPKGRSTTKAKLLGTINAKHLFVL